eukprot:10133116-Alexandrium_andersonii.AAC.1
MSNVVHTDDAEVSVSGCSGGEVRDALLRSNLCLGGERATKESRKFVSWRSMFTTCSLQSDNSW